jgi:hypothetical protein
LAVALAVSAGGGVVGCGAAVESDDDVIDALDLNSEKDDGIARPVGTFEIDPVGAWYTFEKLVLMSDKTFHREYRVMCVRAPCPPLAMNGKYRFSKSGRTNYIRFNDASGAPLDRFAYRMAGNSVLELRAVGKSKWVRFKKATEAWCDEARDCKLQKLMSVLTCVGDWTCGDNTCSFRCGSTPVPGPLCADEGPLSAFCGTRCTNGYKIVDGDVTCTCCGDAPAEPNPCVKTGCSGQLCFERHMASTCEWRPEYACYRNAECARQADGACGWTETPTFRSCLGSN